MTDAPDRLIAALADRYRIDSEIGSGGMATVYLAQDLKHERNVAVKVFRPELAAALGSERFLREIKITAGLNHPHILPLLDSGEADTFLFYVMPHVDGESLRERMDRNRELGTDDALRITGQVASALAYAHSKGIIHRDIKPENILLQADQVVVADFGIALAVDSAGGDRLTETGLSIGTPAYMSPEQVAGEKEMDARSDIYSLGCVLYEMLAGDPPFTASNPRAVLAKHLTDPAPPVTTVRPGVPATVATAIAKALGKSPADRFESALAFTTALSAQAPVKEGMGRKSIVVLPFANFSSDAENEYFSDGLTEEIISDLSRVEPLRVISRTSAMQLKGTEKNTRQIASDLGVQFVLEGSVRRAGERLRITAQLIDAGDEIHLWSDRYDGTFEDVFDFQEQMARSITENLCERLGIPTEPAAPKVSIGDVQAYDYLLQARQLLYRFEADDVRVALEFLGDALEIAGDNVLIYAGMGEAYFLLSHSRKEEFKAHMEKVQECADKIFELDPNSGHGHVLAAYKYYTDQRFSSCFASAKRALEINPNEPSILWFFSFLCSQWGQLEAAQSSAQRFMDIDPLNPFASFTEGIYWMMGEGRSDLAVEPLRRAHRMSPKSGIFAFKYARALASAGRMDEAFEALNHTQNRTDGFAGFGPIFSTALLGDKTATLEALTPEFEATVLVDETTSWHLATTYSLIGEPDEAVRCLSRAVELGFFNYPLLAEKDPLLEGIRGEAAFQELMVKVKGIWERFPEPAEPQGSQLGKGRHP